MFKRFPKLTFAPLVLLLIPLIAMQFTNEVRWGVFDFIIMGVLLMVAGMWTQRVIDRIRSKPNRMIYISLILLLFLLFWIEMAVGIFGSPIAGN
jgi:hypothetical protein